MSGTEKVTRTGSQAVPPGRQDRNPLVYLLGVAERTSLTTSLGNSTSRELLWTTRNFLPRRARSGQAPLGGQGSRSLVELGWARSRQ